jgi:hypothetical protein
MVEVQSASDFPPEPPIQSALRDRLRKWESENVPAMTPHIMETIDKPMPKAVQNSTVRPQSSDFYLELEADEYVDRDDEDINFEHDLVDVGLRRHFLVPGDMVELTYVNIS